MLRTPCTPISYIPTSLPRMVGGDISETRKGARVLLPPTDTPLRNRPPSIIAFGLLPPMPAIDWMMLPRINRTAKAILRGFRPKRDTMNAGRMEPTMAPAWKRAVEEDQMTEALPNLEARTNDIRIEISAIGCIRCGAHVLLVCSQRLCCTDLMLEVRIKSRKGRDARPTKPKS